MPTISELKQLYPNLADYTDHEVVDIYAGTYGMDRKSAASSLGVQINDPGFGTTINRSGGQMAKGVGEIYGDITGNRSNAVTRYADDVIARNPSGINSLGDIVDNPGLALAEGVGNAVTFLGPQLLARGAGLGLQAYGAARGLRTAQMAGQALNSIPTQAAIAGLPSVGEIGDKQRAAGEEDLLAKYAGAGAVGAIENIGGVQRLLGIGRRAPGSIAADFGKTPLRTVAKVATRSALEEGAEELAQTPIEQVAGYQDPTTSESIDETLLGGAMGTIGGLVGLPVAVQRGVRHNTMNDLVENHLSTTSGLLPMQQRAAEAQHAFLVAEQGKPAADAWLSNFMNQAQYMHTQQAQLDEQALQEGRALDLLGGSARAGWQAQPVQDFINNQLGIGAAPAVARSDVRSAFNEKVDPTVIVGEDGTPRTTTNAFDVYDYTNNADQRAVAAPQEADPVIEQLREAAPSAFRAKGDLRVQAKKAYDAYQQFSDNELVRAIEELSAGTPAKWRVPMLEAILAGRQEASHGQPSTVDAQGDAAQRADAGGGAGAAQTGTTIDGGVREVAGAPARGSEPDTLVGDADTDNGALTGALEAVREGPQLPKVEKTVYDYLRAALQDGRGDAVIDSEGVLQYARIGEATGMARGSVKAAVNRLVKRLATTQGVTVAQFKDSLRALSDQRRQQMTDERVVPGDAPQLQPQMTEAVEDAEQASMGVINTVGGSQVETFEDPEATAMAAAEPNPVVEQRQAEAVQRRAQWMAQVLAQPEVAEAAQDWDDMRSDGAAAFNELGDDTKIEWLEVFVNLKDGGISLEEADAAQRRIERSVEHLGAGPGSVVEGVDERVEESEPGDARPADEGARPGDNRVSETAGQGVPSNPLESRVERLRELVGDKQGARLDKLIARLQDGDIDVGRFAEELQALEEQVFPPEQGGKGIQYSVGEGGGSTVQNIIAALLPLFSTRSGLQRKVQVVQSASELEDVAESLSVQLDGRTQAFIADGRAYLIAGNIPEGRELAVFLHEVGVHLGLEGLVGAKNVSALAKQVQAWAQQDGDSQEARLAKRAIARLQVAEDAGVENAEDEVIAYFVEEAVAAGVSPVKSRGPVATWFRQLWAAVKSALRKFGLGRVDQLTAQDIVDVVYGAAGQVLADEVATPSQPVKFSIAGNVTEALQESLPEQVRPQVKYVGTQLREALRSTSNFLRFTEDIVRSAKDLLPTAQKWYDQLARRTQVQMAHKARVDEIGTKFDRLSRHDFKATWGLIHDMTSQGKWGYQPTWRNDVEVDQAMVERYQALPPEAQALLDEVFKFGHQTIKETQAILDQIVEDEYNDALATAATPKARDAVEKRFDSHRKLFSRQLTALEGPYAPMRRVGSHVVVAKSQAMVDAERAGETVFEMRQDPAHYRVEFFDSLADAERRRDELVHDFDEVDAAVREVYSQQNMLPFEAFEKLRRSIQAEGTDGAKEAGTTVKKLASLVSDLYLSSLAETNARKSELRRDNVAGMDADAMYRAFLSKGESDAHYIGVLKNGRAVGTAFAQMRVEANASGPKRHERRLIFNELARRYDHSIDFNPTPLVGKLLNFSSIWMLLTKPAYFFYNATQPLMLTQPALADKHGYKRSFDAMLTAYKELMHLKSFSSLAPIDLHSLPSDVRDAVVELRDMGRIDITITQDLGDRIHGARGKLGRGMQFAERTLKGMAQKVEMSNRVVTAMAAYRLARDKGSDHAKAVQYASDIIYDTHGDYSGLNAPRLMNQNAAMRVITQFRKFQFIQIGQLVRISRDAMRGKTVGEKWALSRALRYTLAHHAILAGAMGLPAANVIASMFALTGGDDEPRELEYMARQAIGDPFLANLLLRGIPAAVFNTDISNNIGMGQTFSILPFADASFGERGGYEKVVTAATGPLIGGFGLQAWGAMGALKGGDYYKGLEGVLPSGLRAATRSMREALGGVENFRGDTLVEPDEIPFMASVVKALGFRTQQDALRQLTRRTAYQFDKFFDERTGQMKREYTDAYEEGDAAAMRELREEWLALQQVRRDAGFKMQPLSTLLRAPRDTAKRESNTAGGVQYTTTNEGFVRGSR